MNYLRKSCVFLCAVTLTGTAIAQAQPQGNDGIEVLTRGPVHEAFAETVIYDPEPDLVVPAQPPEPIEEAPPDQRPDGANVSWISGYWAWDDERNDFIWISGVWRALPPGREWVPGYWGRTSEGYFWSPGYWSDADTADAEVEYLPEPPQTVEAGPNIPAPSPEHVWAPGTWVWAEQQRYAWRPGCWVEARPDWVWVPSHYVWAPPGYVYVDGYWDYDVPQRGVLFAPVYVQRTVIVERPVIHYTPAVTIDLNIFTDHLFVRPAYHHYYFGDYYAEQYETSGFYFGFSFRASRVSYDPICVQRRWVHRREPDWDVRVQATFSKRRVEEGARPPRTYEAQRTLVSKDGGSTDRARLVAARYDDVVKQSGPTRYKAVDVEERKQMADRGRAVKKSRVERQDVEYKAVERKREKPAPDKQPGSDASRTRVKVPRSGLRGPSPSQLGRDRSPPKRVESPRPDPKVEPKPRPPGKTKVKKGGGKP